jgi:hypothetical protein
VGEFHTRVLMVDEQAIATMYAGSLAHDRGGLCAAGAIENNSGLLKDLRRLPAGTPEGYEETLILGAFVATSPAAHDRRKVP